MNIKNDQQPAKKYAKAQPGQKVVKLSRNKKNGFRNIFLVFALLLFIVGAISVVIISRQQELDKGTSAPTAPESQPAAYIPDAEICQTSFTVPVSDEAIACGEGFCLSDEDCDGDLVCAEQEEIIPSNLNSLCTSVGGQYSRTVFVAADEAGTGGEGASCETDYDCIYGYKCQDNRAERVSGTELAVTADYRPVCTQVAKASCDLSASDLAPAEMEEFCNNSKGDEFENEVCSYLNNLDIGNYGFCSQENLVSACSADPGYEACCTEPTSTPTDEPTTTPTDEPTDTPTTTPTDEPTTTPTDEPTTTPTEPPVISQVITTVDCNDSCNENADCNNVSHICYNGRCRLDVNPTDVNCRLPDGGNTIERPVEVPTESGFADWFNYLKAGLGVLGVGSLLLLLL